MDSEPVLSILILSIERRAMYLETLLHHLSRQVKLNSFQKIIEILTYVDNEETPIGTKRNELIKAAKGKYLVFIDDDDTISDNYVLNIINSVKEDVDCVGFLGTVYYANAVWKLNHSLFNECRKIDHRNMMIYNTIRHINPIKSEIAKKFTFSDKYWGEDNDFMNQIIDSKLLKTESFIDEIMYNYTPSQEDLLKQNKDRSIT